MNNTQHKTISVIGAGVMGLSAAYALQKSLPDTRITLYDPKGFPANNASAIAGGMLAPYSELDHMPESYLPAALKSISLWSDISKDLVDSFEFTREGSLLIAHDEDRHILERFTALLPRDGVWEKIGAAGIQKLEPSLLAKFRQGITMPMEAHLNPRKALAALCNVLPDKRQEAVDPAIEAQKVDLVIDARGMGAQGDVKNLRGVKGEIIIVRNPEFTLSRPLRLMHPRYPLYIVPRADHVFLIGATIIESAENDTMSIKSGLELLSALYSLHPSFADAQILEIAAGVRPSFADNLPRIEIQDNIVRANGLYRHGYLLAPVMADIIAAHAIGKEHPHADLFIKGLAHEHHPERQSA